jgi:hypothetical protein
MYFLWWSIAYYMRYTNIALTGWLLVLARAASGRGLIQRACIVTNTVSGALLLGISIMWKRSHTVLAAPNLFVRKQFEEGI